MIHAFYRPRARAWRRAARYAQHTIEYVSQRLLPYPWPHMSAVEGIIGGGMEYPMMTLIGDVSMPYAQQMIIAHELIHMWFPMQVGSNETAHAWQDEGLTDFVTDFVTADFWRRKSTGPGSIAEYVAMARMGADREPLMQHGDRYAPGFGYVMASYNKPKAVLHQLVGMYSADAVFTALRDYAQAWDRRHPTPWDFFASMNRSLGSDLDWYWRTWCYENWRLDVEIAEVRTDGTETVVVVQDLGDAPQPTVVRATFVDGRTEDRTVPVQHWLAGNRSAEVRFTGEVSSVAIDPARMTLDVDPSNNVWRR
jgi:aminopeptidase N